jgi:hypothetical protein
LWKVVVDDTAADYQTVTITFFSCNVGFGSASELHYSEAAVRMARSCKYPSFIGLHNSNEKEFIFIVKK